MPSATPLWSTYAGRWLRDERLVTVAGRETGRGEGAIRHVPVISAPREGILRPRLTCADGRCIRLLAALRAGLEAPAGSEAGPEIDEAVALNGPG